MNTVYNNDELYTKMITLVIEEDDKAKAKGQLLKFYKWLYNHDFLRNLTKFDYDFINEENYLSLSIIRNHKIGIGIDVWDNYCRIGIDPSECFDKISRCSIVARFPLSRREERRFYNTLDKILDKRSEYSKDWFRQASTSWYGSFAKFGDI